MRFPYSTALTRAAATAITTAATAITPIVFPGSLFAQNPPAGGPTCDIDESKPQAVARATFSMTRAQSALKTGNATKDLRDVIAVLNTPAMKNENPVARAYLLGQAYVLMLDQPGVTPITTRSSPSMEWTL